MKYTVFVDGQEGTTGLKINERLESRSDIDIIKIDPDKRKDLDERRKLLNEVDIAFLCLPDTAAKEATALVSSSNTRIIDASTAHRTEDSWAYGIPELSASHRERISLSSRVSVPGCFATGFNMSLYPLIKGGIVSFDYPVTCHAVSGYSGGGKKLIGKYEAQDNIGSVLESPCFYSLGLNHKHLPEMQKTCGLSSPPLFTPMVCNYYKGMTVAIPLWSKMLSQKLKPKEVQEFLSAYYEGQKFVKVMPYGAEGNLDSGYLFATGCNDTNRIELYVYGNDEQIVLLSKLDNLGKGSSGAAVQNMNIMLGLDETIGLEI